MAVSGEFNGRLWGVLMTVYGEISMAIDTGPAFRGSCSFETCLAIGAIGPISNYLLSERCAIRFAHMKLGGFVFKTRPI